VTTLRFALAGAVLFNAPNLFAASVLPAREVALGAVLLAAAGAALGAMVGWAITSRIDAAVATVRVEAPAAERLTA
jgi:membrane protein YqaA with SNARE-associated domain